MVTNVTPDENNSQIPLQRFWQGLSLTKQFGLTAGLVMLLGMAVVGKWVEDQIREGVTNNAAVSTALFMDSFVSPLAQSLVTQDTLTIGPVLAIDELLKNADVAQRVFSIKLWKLDGQVAYSNNLALVGQKFDPSPGLAEAREGEVVASFSILSDPDAGPEFTVGRPVLEIYSPIRERFSGEVIAVLETYEDATVLAQTLEQTRLNSWLLVAGVTIAMVLALLGIVHSGTILIDRQRRSLQNALDQNSSLLRRVERASGRTAELTEQQLRRVSADLHDGPAQLISLAALRIGSLDYSSNNKNTKNEVGVISGALSDAMQDIRDICMGLSLPEIENQSLSEIVSAVVASHEARSGTRVSVSINSDDPPIKAHVKICVYRFLQEGLNNAFRHANGADQRINVENNDEKILELSVFNSVENENLAGVSLSKNNGEPGSSLGLSGLRERVEALGGTFEFSCDATDGARLFMRLELGKEAD